LGYIRINAGPDGAPRQVLVHLMRAKRFCWGTGRTRRRAQETTMPVYVWRSCGRNKPAVIKSNLAFGVKMAAELVGHNNIQCEAQSIARVVFFGFDQIGAQTDHSKPKDRTNGRMAHIKRNQLSRGDPALF
jgi:hypothetical protein